MTQNHNSLAEALEHMKTWARVNSPWVIHFNTGSCNGCDIEILATLTPRYDVERFGVKLKGSPRHADVLLATGPVTAQARQRLVRVYQQMHEPKFVVAIGSCALSGGAFRGCYNVAGGIDKVIPVDAYIPGCLPSRRDHRRRGETARQFAAGAECARCRAGGLSMLTTEKVLEIARLLAEGWTWRLETRQPEPTRLDVVLSSPADLVPYVAALRVQRIGWLSAITGLDLGPEADAVELLYHFCTVPPSACG
jgi:Ni,Fe-hydrogenase III small subunit